MSKTDPRRDPGSLLCQLRCIGKHLRRVRQNFKPYGKRRNTQMYAEPRRQICKLRHLIHHVQRFL